jgi:hypothetical protein
VHRRRGWYFGGSIEVGKRTHKRAHIEGVSRFDMSSLKDALPEPASSGSQHGSDFDMSAMARDLVHRRRGWYFGGSIEVGKRTHKRAHIEGVSRVREWKDALPEPASSGSQHGSDFDMSAMARDLPDPDKAKEEDSSGEP